MVGKWHGRSCDLLLLLSVCPLPNFCGDQEPSRRMNVKKTMAKLNYKWIKWFFSLNKLKSNNLLQFPLFTQLISIKSCFPILQNIYWYQPTNDKKCFSIWTNQRRPFDFPVSCRCLSTKHLIRNCETYRIWYTSKFLRLLLTDVVVVWYQVASYWLYVNLK